MSSFLVLKWPGELASCPRFLASLVGPGSPADTLNKLESVGDISENERSPLRLAGANRTGFTALLFFFFFYGSSPCKHTEKNQVPLEL